MTEIGVTTRPTTYVTHEVVLRGTMAFRPSDAAPFTAAKLVRDLCLPYELPQPIVDAATQAASGMIANLIAQTGRRVELIVEMQRRGVTLRVRDAASTGNGVCVSFDVPLQTDE
ncbi:hypothetical protein [Jatrophihabitans sp. GAS493]|uniref:hypothetical protein n=1 Tax=Jatrophihabitans sp. GAS493 TaxID=1907575 RepID=UPI000BB778A5|nr:hypothetical protein [Jatrophihabitans sp. GAS493]